MSAIQTNLLYTTTRQTIVGLDGVTRTFMTPLIRAPGRPTNGWRVSIPIKGQNVAVEGATPIAVYNNLVAILGRNGLKVTANDIWFNLNLQWLSRTPEKYHAVPLADLLQVSAARGTVAAVDPRKRNYKPSDWGHLAWGWLNLFLAREGYHYREFLLQINYVLDMLNPATNPEIGCAECYRELALKLDDLKKMPETDQAGARKWLVDVHNAVNYKLGKKALTYSEASKKAFWT